MASLLFHMLLVGILLQTTTAIYNLADDYSGDTFFDSWDFFTAADPTNGHVKYQSHIDAGAQGLVKIQRNGNFNDTKQVFIGVDSTALAPEGRPSVRITTQKKYQHALVLADIAHQPGGICGVWPAFWMVGAKWPEMGEVDIVEGVSTQNVNQMTLHTNKGPVLDHKADFSGKLLTANCDVNAPNQANNAGCGIADDSNITFGTDFNAIGGGVYATEWTPEFIKIWFFPRNKIPADIQQGAPNPGDSWGTPNSLFQGNFSMDDHFKDLQIVMNTAFCGDWAGNTWSQTPECAALAPTCDDYVTNNPKAFEQAFWLVNSVKVFQQDGQATNVSTPLPPSTLPPGPPSTVLPGPPSTARPHRPKKTITQTVTVYTGATPTPPLPPAPPASSLSTFAPLGPQPQSASGGTMGPPGTIFGSPGTNLDKVVRRNGGAVLPMQLRKL